MNKKILEGFDTDHWVRLLREFPSFDEHAPWEKFDNRHWRALVTARKELMDRCPNPYALFGRDDWRWLFQKHPDLVDTYPLHLSGRYAGFVIAEHKHLVDKVDWAVLGDSAVFAVAAHPELVDRLVWDDIEYPSSLAHLVINRPEFFDKVKEHWIDKGRSLGADFWRSVLEHQPQLAEYCDFGCMRENILTRLVIKQEKLVHTALLKSLTPSGWFDILMVRPQLVDYCPILSKFTERQVGTLIKKHPELEDKLALDAIEDAEFWIELLRRKPELAIKLPRPENHRALWTAVLSEVPEARDHIDWGSLIAWMRRSGRKSWEKHYLRWNPTLAKHMPDFDARENEYREAVRKIRDEINRKYK